MLDLGIRVLCSREGALETDDIETDRQSERIGEGALYYKRTYSLSLSFF